MPTGHIPTQIAALLVVNRWSALLARSGESRYGRNFVRLLSTSVMGQAVVLVSAPLLSRIFSPADFGMLGVLTAVASVLLAFATARCEWSVPNPKSAIQAGALMLVGGGMLCIACLAVGIGLPFVDWARLPSEWREVKHLAWMLVPLLAGGGAQQLLQAWHVRGGELTFLSRATLLQNLSNVATALSIGLIWGNAAGALGLTSAAILGTLIGAGVLWIRAVGLGGALGSLTWRRVTATWRRYQRQSMWSMLASVLNALSLAIVPLMLARHYGAMEVGLYALMYRITLAPIGAVGSAVRQSFWAEAALHARIGSRELRPLFVASSRRLTWFAVPIALVALAGPLYIGPVFGSEQWSGAGWVLAASVPMMLGQAIVSPLSHLEVHGKQGWQAGWDLVRGFSLIVTIECAGRAQIVLPGTVFALSMVGAVTYLALYLLNLRALKAIGGRTA